MSRLDSFIRRMKAQRDCLDAAAAALTEVPGAVFELGLGNGRTYDHLRDLMPEREIFVFDRQVAAHPDCIPDADHMIVGDVTQTLAPMTERHAGAVALVHIDIGTGDTEASQALSRQCQPLLYTAMTQGGWIISDQPLLDTLGWEPVPLPETVAPGRYFLYRKP